MLYQCQDDPDLNKCPHRQECDGPPCNYLGRDEKEDLLDILEAYVNEWTVAHMYDRMEIMAGLVHEPLSLQMARAALEANRVQR